MNNKLLIYKNILTTDEQVVEEMFDLKMQLAGFGNDDQPGLSEAGVILTNKRIIIVFFHGSAPRLYSSFTMIGLYERPFLRWSPKEKDCWPYQANVRLPSGVNFLIETIDRTEEAGEKLSRFLNRVFFSLKPSGEVY